ncbi:hypothetical protein [Polyangium aurulentum]|uniref:hypothetical protein n=1 Tax=Polyangium aurulentum TaxID=2567896 RepID=UPI0010AE502D|nr:hypothetical protein [Polyangium aurulentum]UQA60401.1 hypothetical protein E8A73_007980 [Polyangium aurulentum]
MNGQLSAADLERVAAPDDEGRRMLDWPERAPELRANTVTCARSVKRRMDQMAERRVKTHFATNGDVLYEVEVDLGEGRRGAFKWRQPSPRPEFIGFFEHCKAGRHDIERAIPHGQRGAFRRERERARGAVLRESLMHPWLKYVAKASPCIVYRNDVRCLSERHTLPLPAMFKKTKGARARRPKRR